MKLFITTLSLFFIFSIRAEAKVQMKCDEAKVFSTDALIKLKVIKEAATNQYNIATPFVSRYADLSVGERNKMNNDFLKSRNKVHSILQNYNYHQDLSEWFYIFREGFDFDVEINDVWGNKIIKSVSLPALKPDAIGNLLSGQFQIQPLNFEIGLNEGFLKINEISTQATDPGLDQVSVSFPEYSAKSVFKVIDHIFSQTGVKARILGTTLLLERRFTESKRYVVKLNEVEADTGEPSNHWALVEKMKQVSGQTGVEASTVSIDGIPYLKLFAADGRNITLDITGPGGQSFVEDFNIYVEQEPLPHPEEPTEPESPTPSPFFGFLEEPTEPQEPETIFVPTLENESQYTFTGALELWSESAFTVENDEEQNVFGLTEVADITVPETNYAISSLESLNAGKRSLDVLLKVQTLIHLEGDLLYDVMRSCEDPIWIPEEKRSLYSDHPL